MTIPSAASLSDQIPTNLKTVSVARRHNVFIAHAVPALRVLERLPALPPSITLDTLPVNGETCAFLMTMLRFNDDFHYTPLPLPNLSFWSLDFAVLVRRERAEGQARETGNLVIKSFLGTRAAWVLRHALAGESAFAHFNVVMRGTTGETYAPLIADIHPDNGTPTTQIAVRQEAAIPLQSPFVSAAKMTEFLLHRPTSFSALSVGHKFVGLQSQSNDIINVLAGELASVGGEVSELKLGVWEKMGLVNTNELRQPYAILIQPESKTVLQSPALL